MIDICKWCLKTKDEHQLEYDWIPKYYCTGWRGLTKYHAMDNLEYIEYLANTKGLLK